jgi:uncharacterized membrane protein HdeD (DUF308 family)
VLTLIAETGRTNSRQISAFGTPTVIHFSASLWIAAMMSAPWDSFAGARAAFGVLGILGIAYTVRSIVHALHQRGYKPDAEDWFWYFALPLIAYSLLFLAAFLLITQTTRSLFLIATVAITLLFNGIHNSWDTVTYIVTSNVLNNKNDKAAAQQSDGPPDN